MCKHHNRNKRNNNKKIPQILTLAVCSTVQFVRTKANLYILKENKPIDSKDNCDSKLRASLKLRGA